MKNRTKFWLSFSMIILSVAMMILTGPTWHRFFICGAVIAAFIGDLKLMDYGSQMDEEQANEDFIAALKAFSVTHIFYIVGFSFKGLPNSPEDFFSKFGIGIGIGFIIAMIVIGIFAKKFFGKICFELEMEVYAYAEILCVTLIIIYAYALSNFRLIPAAVGITLFAISDILIAIREFNSDIKIKNIAKWIWALYITGQTLLILS